MAKKEEPDLVPYYRPGTTEPEMVPRGSVPGGLPEVEAPESEPEPEAKPAKAATKASRKK